MREMLDLFPRAAVKETAAPLKKGMELWHVPDVAGCWFKSRCMIEKAAVS